MDNKTPPKPTPTTNPDPDPKPHPISFTNGILKRHHQAPTLASGPLFTHKECLKNHAASLGGYALDGCGEFMPAPTCTPSDPTSLKCAACGCHRNFHRRELADVAPTPAVIEYHPHHRHHPLPPRSPGGSRSISPPPISSTYAPHMLLALSTNPSDPTQNPAGNTNNNNNNNNKKRFRTKFSQDQKDKMYELAEKVGWKMHKSNEDLVNGSCREIGVERGVFKVWMHNNKNTFGRRSGGGGGGGGGADIGFEIRTLNGNVNNGNNNVVDGDGNSQSTSSLNNEDGVNHVNHHLNQFHVHQHRQLFGSNESNAPTNASSSSS